MPQRFDLKYIGADNAEHRPVVIHRAIFGSFERFIALLIEHYAGAFPLWLAPLQAIVLPIADRHLNTPGPRPPGSAAGDCASRWTSARRRSVIRSARPSCRRCPTCWWWATGRPPKGTVSVRSRTGRRPGARRSRAFIEGDAREICARGARR
jgi:threonyl-tRNA synthetase